MSMPEALVSIIIPVYNSERTLERAVRSALDQSWTSKEILIADDGSDDGSGALAEQLAAADDRIRVLHLQKVMGVSAARNAGLRAAEGSFVTFLDADDAMDPRMLEELMVLHGASGADLCGCTFQSCRPDMQPEDGRSAAERKTTLYTGSGIVRQCFLAQHDTRVWSKLFTRRILEGHFFDESLTIGEDSLFVLSLLRPDTVYALMEEPLYLYTVNPEGAMERPFVPAYMDQLRCWEKVEALLRQNFPDLLKEPESAARFSALQVVSAVLTASKIERLPEPARSEYELYFAECRQTAGRAGRTRGTRAFLPKDYRLKAFLLTKLPGLYRRLYRNLK